MLVARVIPGVSFAASTVGAGMLLLGQAVFDPFAATAERIVGGTVLFVAGGIVVRWTFRLLKEARSNAAEDRRASLERESILIDALAKSTDQLAELSAQLAAERQLRLSLEAMGYENRRRNGYDDDATQDEGGSS